MAPGHPRVPQPQGPTRGAKKPGSGGLSWSNSPCQPGVPAIDFTPLPRPGLGPWSWLETSARAGGIIMPISCDTQIDCRQGDITRALFLISNLLLHVIRVCGVCVCFSIFFFHFGELISPRHLLCFSLQRITVGLGRGQGLASILFLFGPGQACSYSWGPGCLQSLGLDPRCGHLRAERGC